MKSKWSNHDNYSICNLCKTYVSTCYESKPNLAEFMTFLKIIICTESVVPYMHIRHLFSMVVMYQNSSFNVLVKLEEW